MIETDSLYHYSLFGGVPEDAMARILPLMTAVDFEEGQVIMSEGEINDRVYFIEGGRVEVSREGVRLVELGEGDTFGEMELIDIMPTAATVRALAPVHAIVITNRAFHQIYKDDVRVFAMMIMNLARDISRRMRKLDQRVIDEELGK